MGSMKDPRRSRKSAGTLRENAARAKPWIRGIVQQSQPKLKAAQTNQNYFTTQSKMKKLFAIASIAVSFAATSAAEVTEGVLEKGPTHSALFTISPESGDLVGYAFKNQSTVGKTILQSCLPGMLCKLGESSTRPLDDATGLKFDDQPSGWYEITKARDVGMEAAVFGYEKSLKTRYGVVSVREEDNFLLFQGKPVKPAIEGNSSLSIVANYEIGKIDVLLLQNAGGTACPALFHFVHVGPTGLRVSPEFGTCSDIIYPSFDPKTGVTVSMIGFQGPSQPVTAQRKAAMSKTVYRWTTDGRVTENGKSVR